MEYDSAPAQPTLSQQVRRLEQMVGTPLLSRRRDGLHLTAAGRVLLEESRTVLSMFEHGLRRSRQVAGLDRLRLRFVVPPHLPDSLAANAAARQRSVAAAYDVEIIWLEAPLDVGFSVVCLRPADAALGWLRSGPAALPDSLETIELEIFEPELWIPAALALAFAAAATRPTAVLSGPLLAAGGKVMRGDVPRHLQQVLFDTADAEVCPLSRTRNG
jgi:DNA-binding transcriptional LysR family regulator